MVKQYIPCSVIKEYNTCPRCNTKVEVGILLKEKHYFTKSKHIIVYMCDKCGKTWSVNYK